MPGAQLPAWTLTTDRTLVSPFYYLTVLQIKDRSKVGICGADGLSQNWSFPPSLLPVFPAFLLKKYFIYVYVCLHISICGGQIPWSWGLKRL